MASREQIDQLNALARAHHRLRHLSTAELPAGGQRLKVNPSHVSNSMQIILDRIQQIAEDDQKNPQ